MCEAGSGINTKTLKRLFKKKKRNLNHYLIYEDRVKEKLTQAIQ